jgi:hypothetical protein
MGGQKRKAIMEAINFVEKSTMGFSQSWKRGSVRRLLNFTKLGIGSRETIHLYGYLWKTIWNSLLSCNVTLQMRKGVNRKSEIGRFKSKTKKKNLSWPIPHPPTIQL